MTRCKTHGDNIVDLFSLLIPLRSAEFKLKTSRDQLALYPMMTTCLARLFVLPDI